MSRLILFLSITVPLITLAQDEIEFNVPPSIKGTVIDKATGRPVDHAKISYHGYFWGVFSEGELQVAHDGAFEIPEFPESFNMSFSVYASGFVTAFFQLNVLPGSPYDLPIGLTRELMATGRVFDDQGRSVRDATIIVDYPDTQDFANNSASITQQNDGSFQLEGLVPNTPISISAILDGEQTNSVTIFGNPGEVIQQIELRLPYNMAAPDFGTGIYPGRDF